MHYGNSISFPFFSRKVGGGGGGGGGGGCGGDETTIFVFFIFGRETAKPPIFPLKDITKHI